MRLVFVILMLVAYAAAAFQRSAVPRGGDDGDGGGEKEGRWKGDDSGSEDAASVPAEE